MHIFGQIWPFVGQKSTNFYGSKQCFGTHITEKPPRHFVCLFFWSGMQPHVAKIRIFGQNMAVFWAKNLNFYGREQKFGCKHNGKPPRHLVCIVFWTGIGWNGQKCQYLAKKASFGPNLAVFGAKIHFLRGWSKTFGTFISGHQWDTSFKLKTLTGKDPIGR